MYMKRKRIQQVDIKFFVVNKNNYSFIQQERQLAQQKIFIDHNTNLIRKFHWIRLLQRLQFTQKITLTNFRIKKQQHLMNMNMNMNNTNKQSIQSKTFPSSQIVVTSLINQIVEASQNQAIQNKIFSSFMNPFTSDKVNSTINEIANLIYQQAQDSNPHKKYNHFKQLLSPKYLQKDNLFTNGVDVQITYKAKENSELETSRLNRNQRLSVYSFRTNISKLPIHVSSMDNFETQNQPFNKKMTIPSKRRQQTLEAQNHFISLQPQSNQNRTSAFDRAQTQNTKQRMIEVQINDFRQQKIIQEEKYKKSLQQQKKFIHLLSGDEVITTFDYTGDFIKKTKRQLAMMANAQDNRRIVQTGLLIRDTQKFWKSKNNRNATKPRDLNSSNNQLKNFSIKQKDQGFKKTTIQKIEELKKKSILVEFKKKISDSQKKVNQKKAYRENSYLNGGQNLSQEEQAKIKQHHFQFLSKNLNSYHEKGQNFMPEWMQKVQKGCKMTIYVGDGEEDKTREKQKQKQIEKKSHRSLSERSSKTETINENQEIQIIGTKKGKKNGGIGNLSKVKNIQNLKAAQLSQIEIVQEWGRRIHIKSLDAKPNPPKQRKRSSNLKNSRTIMLLQSKELARKNTAAYGSTDIQNEGNSRVKISKEVQILNQKTHSKRSQKNLKQARFESMQDDDTKSQVSFSNIQNPPKTKLNLNKKEFQKLKKYLKNKNSIVTRNDTIKKDSMQFFLGSQKKEAKVPQVTVKASDVAQIQEQKLSIAALAQTTVQIQTQDSQKFKLNTQPINEEEEESTIHQNRLSQKHRRLLTLAWKPRSFSVNDKRYSTCKSQKEKYRINTNVQGSIKVNSEKLKGSLLKDTVDFDLSKSSILNPNNGSKSRLKSTSSQIKWELTEKSKLKSIRQSEKKQISNLSVPNSSKIAEIPQNINFNESSLSKIVGKQTPKTQSTSIIISKPKANITRTNLLKNAAR